MDSWIPRPSLQLLPYLLPNNNTLNTFDSFPPPLLFFFCKDHHPRCVDLEAGGWVESRSRYYVAGWNVDPSRPSDSPSLAGSPHDSAKKTCVNFLESAFALALQIWLLPHTTRVQWQIQTEQTHFCKHEPSLKNKFERRERTNHYDICTQHTPDNRYHIVGLPIMYTSETRTIQTCTFFCIPPSLSLAIVSAMSHYILLHSSENLGEWGV